MQIGLLREEASAYRAKDAQQHSEQEPNGLVSRHHEASERADDRTDDQQAADIYEHILLNIEVRHVRVVAHEFRKAAGEPN